MKILIKNLFLLILLMFVYIHDSSFAGAWVQARGHYYTKLTFIYSKADGLYGINFPAKFNDYSLYFYGEYGLFNRTSIILSAPTFKHSINEANSVRGKTTGYIAGDIESQIKYQFLDKPIVASALIGTKIPAVYDVLDFPSLGNGETDFDTKLLLGVSLYQIPAYLTGDIGYRLRGGDFEDEIQFNFEAGYTFFKKYLLRAVTTGIKSTSMDAGQSELLGFPLSQEQIRIGGGIIYKLTQKIEFDVTYLKTTSGDNIPKANEFFIGVAFKN
jgi:hypothetical protein